MPRFLLCLTVALAPAAAVAQGSAPMQSVHCQQALRAVQDQEAQIAAAQQVDPQAALPRNRAALDRLEALRQRAAQVCLTNRPDRPSSRPGQLDRPSSRPDRPPPR
jgi:hypothetical protein